MTPDLGMGDHSSHAGRTPLFRQITFVGLGLINGSIARDVRRLGLAGRLVGTARRAETRDEACALGLVDEATPDAAAAVRDADLVVLGCHLVDFWINIALCQSLIVEAAEDDGPPIYQV